MSVLLDAGAFIAIERGDRALAVLVMRERVSQRLLITHGGIVGQVWRGGSGRQANLARFLPGVDVRPIDDELGRRAGVLLEAAGTDDVIDAALVLLARNGDVIVTSDTPDLAVLVSAAGLQVDLLPI